MLYMVRQNHGKSIKFSYHKFILLQSNNYSYTEFSVHFIVVTLVLFPTLKFWLFSEWKTSVTQLWTVSP